MQNLYVKFTVEVSDNEYSFRGQSGEAEMTIQVPRSALQHVNAPGLFYSILTAALVNFDTARVKAVLEGDQEGTAVQSKEPGQNL